MPVAGHLCDADAAKEDGDDEKGKKKRMQSISFQKRQIKGVFCRAMAQAGEAAGAFRRAYALQLFNRQQ